MLAIVELIILLPLIGAIVNGILGRSLGKTSGYIATTAVGLSMLLGLIVLSQVMGGSRLDENVYTWIASGSFSAGFGFLVDALSAIMVVTVTTVAFVIHVYSLGYMAQDQGVSRFSAYLNLCVFSMLVLVLANNYLLMFAAWGGVGVCSYLLIGFRFEHRSDVDAGKKAFIVSRIGDFGILIAIFLMFGHLETVRFGVVFTQVEYLTPGVATAIALLLFLGACAKSAQFPLFVWLPDSAKSPIPAAALIHGVTTVTAGIYLVARSNVLFTLSPTAGAVVAWVGIATALLAASVALVSTNLRRALSYSAISQLGFTFVGLGVGAYTASVLHLITLAFSIGLLFLAAGCVIRAMRDEPNMRKYGGLLPKMKVTGYTFIAGTVAIAGIPPLSGFWSTNLILEGSYYAHSVSGHNLLWALGVAGVAMTSCYAFRIIFMTFFGTPRDQELHEHAHESQSSLSTPLILLAMGAVLVGGLAGYPLANGWINHFLDPVLGSQLQGGGMTPMTLHAISVLAGIAGLSVALALHRTGRLGGVSESSLHKVVYREWYVDDAYRIGIINPVQKAGLGLWNIVDTILIEGLVNASAYAVRGIAWVSSRFQTGRLQTYALWMLVGAVVMIYAVTAR